MRRRLDTHVIVRCAGSMDTSTRFSLAATFSLRTVSPSIIGISSVNAPCIGATLTTVVVTRQSRSSSIVRSTRTKAGKRLLSQRGNASPPRSVRSRVSCSDPDSRR